jgi:hypothetical protein
MPRPRLFLVAIFCGVLVLGLAEFRSAAAAEELDPLIVCKDTQKLVFENQFVRVVEERVPAGVSQVKHQHRHGVSVALSDYTNEEVSYPSREKVRRSRKAGDAGWREASVHKSRNLGITEEHLMRIELKY